MARTAHPAARLVAPDAVVPADDDVLPLEGIVGLPDDDARMPGDDVPDPVVGVPTPRGPQGRVPPGPGGVRAHRVPRVRRHLLATTAVTGALALAVVGVDLWQNGVSPAPSTSAQEVSEALGAAGAAQEAFRDVHGGYTVDPGDLVRSGWQPDPDVDVALVSASLETFCLAAGPAGEAPTVWLDQSWQPLGSACG